MISGCRVADHQPAMQFRDDIIRGMRLAAIVFAAVLILLIGYRMLHGTQSQAAPPPPPPPPSRVPEKAEEKPRAPDPLAVPAPPSVNSPRKGAVRKATPKKEVVPVPLAPVVHNADVDPSPQPPPVDLPLRSVTANTLPVPEVAEDPGVPASTPEDKAAPRRKGGLRAVGRFLHIGKQ